LLAIAAEKFGCRPSRMVGLRDAVLALDFDLAAAAKLMAAERSAAQVLMEDSAAAPFAARRTRYVRW
jgi:hypothetical protein